MSRILRIGMHGDDVLDLQGELHAAGFNVGLADGWFGKKTESGVKAFQLSAKLTVDGIVGPKTIAALAAKIRDVPVVGEPVVVYKTLSAIDASLEKGTVAWYQAAYLICEFDGSAIRNIEAAANRIAEEKDLYIPVEEARGVPWYMIGLIHALECNNHPKGVLHNGELIVGTSQVTSLVPQGRGPFSTFYESALDAIDLQSLWHVPDWTVGNILKQCEAFNGLGYLKWHRKENSPYVWGCTNINDGTGKYTVDGKWSEYADANTQVGVAGLLKWLERRGIIKLQYK